VSRRTFYADYQSDLACACLWLGIEHGRAARYGKLLRQFHEENKRSAEHILAYAESCEIVDVFKLWQRRIVDFPGLDEKVRAALRKGPVLREDENPASSSNRARNDAFVYLLAGTLLEVGTPVRAVDGIPALHTTCQSEADFTLECEGSLIDVECKRPQSYNALEPRVREARKQITRRDGRHGVIAIDCSVLIRPPGQLLESDSAEAAESHVSLLLENDVYKRVVNSLTSSILGFILFARVPTMVRLVNSEWHVHRECVSSWLVVSNSNYAGDPEFLQRVARQLDEAFLTR
jgi:hypothetical protein